MEDLVWRKPVDAAAKPLSDNQLTSESFQNDL